VALLGAAAWNYQRNLAAERERPRPFRGYADAELDALEGAYRSELGAWRARHASAREGRQGVRERGLLDERIDEFERAHREGRRERALGAEVAEREAALRELVEERRLRRAESDALALHLRRLLVF
jgi:hypothetical protein